MTNTKRKQIMNQVLEEIESDVMRWSLLRYKKEVIDNWDSDYHVDFDIQRNPYFTHSDAVSYLQSWFSGADLSFIYMVNIPTIWNTLDTENQRGTPTYEYFKNLEDEQITWLSVDGNNRNHAWKWFFNNDLKLPKGFRLPLWNTSNDSKYVVTLTKSMTYQDIMNTWGEEFNSYMKNSRKLYVLSIQKCTKSQLHNIFRCINQGKKLEPQEDRNCIDVEIAEWVRRISNDDDKFGKFFKTQWNEKSLDKRTHESFVAWTSSMIQNFGNYFPSEFGKSSVGNITESSVTNDYENENITNETMTKTKGALNKLKDFVNWTNSGVKYISSQVQFTRALTMLFHELRTNYTDHDWSGIYEWIDSFHTRMKKQDETDVKTGDEKNYYFMGKSDGRTYSQVMTAGTTYLPHQYQLLVSEIGLMVANGLIKKKLTRGSFGHDTRKELYEIQNHVCPITGNKIVGYNDGSKYHVDHIIPISKWLTELDGQDPNHISNLQLVEKRANLVKSDKILTQTSIEKFVKEDEMVEA